MQSFDRNVTGIGVLADPVRRKLYRFVCSQDQPVTRDQAAASGWRCPPQGEVPPRPVGGGRTARGRLCPVDRTRRAWCWTSRRSATAGAAREFAVTLPARDYELAGHIMADAISDSARNGTPIFDALNNAAAAYGAAIAASSTDHPSGSDAALDFAVRILTEHAYEPRRIDRSVVMANCPFHALAVGHTELVCRLNHSLLTGFVDSVASDLLEARLEPGENRCCVTLVAFPGRRQIRTFDAQRSGTDVPVVRSSRCGLGVTSGGDPPWD